MSWCRPSAARPAACPHGASGRVSPVLTARTGRESGCQVPQKVTWCLPAGAGSRAKAGRVPAPGMISVPGAVVGRGARGAQGCQAGPVVVATQQQVHRVPAGSGRRHDNGEYGRRRAAAGAAGRRDRPDRELVVCHARGRGVAFREPALHVSSVAAPHTGQQGRKSRKVPVRGYRARAAGGGCPQRAGGVVLAGQVPVTRVRAPSAVRLALLFPGRRRRQVRERHDRAAGRPYPRRRPCC